MRGRGGEGDRRPALEETGGEGDRGWVCGLCLVRLRSLNVPRRGPFAERGGRGGEAPTFTRGGSAKGVGRGAEVKWFRGEWGRKILRAWLMLTSPGSGQGQGLGWREEVGDAA